MDDRASSDHDRIHNEQREHEQCPEETDGESAERPTMPRRAESGTAPSPNRFCSVCGVVNTPNRGRERASTATRLLRYICENVLPDDGELWMNDPTDKGKEFFKSLIDSDDKIFGRKAKHKYARRAIRLWHSFLQLGFTVLIRFTPRSQ